MTFEEFQAVLDPVCEDYRTRPPVYRNAPESDNFSFRLGDGLIVIRHYESSGVSGVWVGGVLCDGSADEDGDLPSILGFLLESTLVREYLPLVLPFPLTGVDPKQVIVGSNPAEHCGILCGEKTLR